ncbi:hypothetical protein [Streptomyces xanthochromogenes]|uniref:hypothetical protein n=1 Tax=Streptomyces xanthochromogenes TaxID=67384 RepID=UPI003429AA72
MDGIVKTGATFARDLAERVLSTFVVAVAGVAIAAGPADMFHASFWQSVGAAGIAAGASLIKGFMARAIGDKNSASTLPGV